MNDARWKIGVYAILIAFALWSIYLYFFNPALLTTITREDSVTETVSAIAYLLSAGIFIVAWIRGGFQNVFLLGYGLLFFVVGGEEISWGQRIIGLQTPAILLEVNVQNETNLHNIEGIYQHVRMIALLVVLTISILMPLTRQWLQSFRTLYDRFAIPVVPIWTIPLTIIAVLFMAVPRLFWRETIFALDEIGELYLSVVFLFFAISVRNSVRNF
jgi:hypothetical protein